MKIGFKFSLVVFDYVCYASHSCSSFMNLGKKKKPLAI